MKVYSALAMALLVATCFLAYYANGDASSNSQGGNDNNDELAVNDEGREMVMVRQTRANKGRNKAKGQQANRDCRYTKGTWSECNPATNQRVRTMTLKKAGGGDAAGATGNCEPTRQETKKCKKSCRYMKGQWSECNPASNQMERLDNLKSGSDPSCDPTQKKMKKCKGKNKKGRH